MDAEFHLPGVEALRREDMWGIIHDDNFKTALLRGCAGSGKTTVAIYRLLRHTEQGNRVRLFTYQNMLVSYIKNLVVKKEKKLQLDDYITTFHFWYNQVDGYLNTNHPPSASAILAALEKKVYKHNTVDELLIDEGQDLPVEIFEALPNVFNRVIVSGDIAQNVQGYPPDHVDRIEETLKNNHMPFKPYTLGQNFRNTYETYYFARQFIPKTNREVWDPNIINRIKARGRRGRKPIVIPYTDSVVRDEHMRKVLLDARVGSVGILCPIGPKGKERYTGESVEGVYDLITSWGLPATKYYSGCDKPTVLKRYIVTTFKSSKGLEFDVVVIPRINFFRKPSDLPNSTIQEEMYVASTRARGQLYIYRDQVNIQFDPIADFDPTTYESPHVQDSEISFNDVDDVPF